VIEAELVSPYLVTVGYTGVPGERTFYLQAEDEAERVSLMMEKEQVAAIGQLLAQLLSRVDDEPASDWDRRSMDLRGPVEPRWRVGEMSVGLDPDAERFVLELAELTEDASDEPREVRIWADRDQVRRLASHAVAVVGEGRPTCQLCGRALDDGHVCPATNGHGRLTGGGPP